MVRKINHKARDVEIALRSLADDHKAKVLARFFKTGQGQYGEGDVFLGITVPRQRLVSKRSKELSLSEIEKLLKNEIHEVRFTGLQILVERYNTADAQARSKIVGFYLRNSTYVNNWDLVDTSAPYIIGDYVLSGERSILYDLVKSKDLWRRRISVLGTMFLIKSGDFVDIFKIVDILMNDQQDLIHKACGWMLREVGKKDVTSLVTFLSSRYKDMPRTMLRYSIERFDKTDRDRYLRGTI